MLAACFYVLGGLAFWLLLDTVLRHDERRRFSLRAANRFSALAPTR